MGIPRRQRRLAGHHALVDGIAFAMPVASKRAASIIAAFPIDLGEATKLLPPGDVHPFRYGDKALLVATVVDYRETVIGPYIEYSLAIACTQGAKPAPAYLPALLMGTFGTGQYVHDLPVSSEISVKGGKGIWGMPKHQANLDFAEGKAWVSSQYDLDGQMVARFDVRVPKSFWLPLNMAAVNYCTFRGMIMKSTIHVRGRAGVHLMKAEAARLILGDHPRADSLRRLRIEPKPVFAAYLPKVTGLLDDRFECWFVTPDAAPIAPIGEGLETTVGLRTGQAWLAPPARDRTFDLDEA